MSASKFFNFLFKQVEIIPEVIFLSNNLLGIFGFVQKKSINYSTHMCEEISNYTLTIKIVEQV